MRWPMPVLAYYLLDAGVPTEAAVANTAIGYQLTNGDEDFYRPSSLDPTYVLVGAYAILERQRDPEWPYGLSKLAADARILAKRYASGEGDRFVAEVTSEFLPEWVLELARQAVANPIAGIASNVVAEQQRHPAFGNLPSFNTELPNWRV